MEQPAFNFPKPIAAVVSLLPTFPPSFAFTQMLNLALDRVIRINSLQPLHGKRVAIFVKDVGLNLNFIIDAGKFMPARSGTVPDMTISATAQDFFLLATRREDPDTLFFSRRLMVEGDTELGLVAKNALDAIELPKLDPAFLSPRNVMVNIKSRLFHG
jgi:O2-independent ubiquinone biosynthesis accessory factor UbiT